MDTLLHPELRRKMFQAANNKPVALVHPSPPHPAVDSTPPSQQLKYTITIADLDGQIIDVTTFETAKKVTVNVQL